MSKNIFRTVKDKNNPYVILNKQYLNDENLSLQAVGLLTKLLANKDDYCIYLSCLTKKSKNGIDSIRNTMNELIVNKYVYRQKKKNVKGQFKGYIYKIFERPVILDKNVNLELLNDFDINNFENIANRTILPETGLPKSGNLNTNNNNIYNNIYKQQQINSNTVIQENNIVADLTKKINDQDKKINDQDKKINDLTKKINNQCKKINDLTKNSYNQDSKNNNSCKSVENQDIQEWKNKIEKVICSDIARSGVIKLLNQSNTDKINYYLDNWSRFESINKNNITGFFIQAVTHEYALPNQYKSISSNKPIQPIQATNYSQRKYGDDFFMDILANKHLINGTLEPTSEQEPTPEPISESWLDDLTKIL